MVNLRTAMRNVLASKASRPRSTPGGGSSSGSGGSSTVLATPTFTAGYATFAVPLAQGELPSGQSLKVGTLATQTDVKSTWADGSARLAVVTCKPTGTAALDVAQGTAASGTFAPTVPTAVVTLTQLEQFFVLGEFNITSGTLKVVITNTTTGRTVADAVKIASTSSLGSTTVIDDGGSGYSSTGTWTTYTGVGYQLAGVRYAAAGAGTATATYTFTGLASDTFRVGAMWTDWTGGTGNGPIAMATDAQYQIYDNTTLVATLKVNQAYRPYEMSAHKFGSFSITSGTLKVTVADTDSTGHAICGAVTVIKDDGTVWDVIYPSSSETRFTQSNFAQAYTPGLNSQASYKSTPTPGGGTATATYTFTGLASGTYVVHGYLPFCKDVGDGSYYYGHAQPYVVKDNATTRGTYTADMQSPNSWNGSTTYTATLSGSVGSDLWLNGALVQEWRRYQSPVDGGSVAHPYLQVVWDVRCYDDGTSRVDVTLENPFCQQKAQPVCYSVDITVNGSSVFTSSYLEHFVGARWRYKTAAGGLSESSVTPDMAPYYRSKAFPRYQSDTAIVPNNSWTTSGLTYDVLQRGGLTYNQMDQAGGRPELAPYPDWQAQYSIHKGSSQRTATLLNGDYAGSQSLMHVREDDQSLPSIDARPNWYLSISGEAGTDPVLCNFSTGAYCNLDRNPLYPNHYHAVSLAFLPYLLTGDRYYHDEVLFWANWCLGLQAPSRHGSQGIVCNDGNVRGIGWMLRLITEAAAFAADADPMRAILRDKLANNLTWCDAYAAGTQAWEYNNSHVHNTTEINSSFIYPNQVYTPDGGSNYACYMALWQQNIVVYAITRANDLGFTGGTDLRNRLALHQVGALTNDPDWPRATYGTGYYPGWGTFPAGSPAEANWTMKTTWASAYQLNVDDGQVAEFGSTGFAFYGQDARFSSLIAQEAGLSGGSSAYTYIDGVMAATPTLYFNRGGWAFSSTRYA